MKIRLKGVWATRQPVKQEGYAVIAEKHRMRLLTQHYYKTQPYHPPPKQEEEKHFTREEVEGFAEWSATYDYYFTEDGRWYCHTGHSITTSQLLDLYIEHLKTKV
jgi:hypothetical protein